jgi:peptide/nickel transport system substrate-binding protein
MSVQYRLRRAAAGLCVALAGMAGCLRGRSGHSTRPAHPGGEIPTLYRRLEAEPATLNPILQTSDFEGRVLALVARNLIDVDDRLQPIGGLCDRWEVTPDLRSYTFHLRQEAVWEDGRPVTARDAVLTLERIADPKSAAILFSPGLESFTGAEELDAKTFRADFARPYAFRLTAFRFPLLPASRYGRADLLAAPENRTPVSDGPYRLAGWRTGEAITLVRNERYWGERAGFDRIVLRVLPEQSQAYRALLRGELDETRLSFEQSRRAASDPEFSGCCRLLRFYDFSFFYLGYNNRRSAFADALTRRALTMLIDRQAIVDRLYGGEGRLLSGPWPAEMTAYDRSVAPYPYDPAAAGALLGKAGWRRTARGLSRKGAPFRFDLLYAATSNASRQVAELVAAAFAGAGVECRPLPVEWASLTRRMDAGDFDAVLASWANDLNPDLYPCWHSSQAPPRGMNNLSYASPAADSLIEAARAEPDEQKRTALFHALHRVLHQDEPATWFFQIAQQYAVARRIDRVRTSPLGLFRFWPGAGGWRPATNSGSAPAQGRGR